MKYIGFIIGGNEYSVPIQNVQEIMNTPSITGMPQSPGYIKGITNLRGRLISIVDLRQLMGISEATQGNKVIVLSIGRVSFGILVDAITGVIEVDNSAVESAENIMSTHIDQVAGIAKVGDRLLTIIDPRRLIPVTDMHIFEDEVVEVKETSGGMVEITRKVDGIAGDMYVKETRDAKEYLQSRQIGTDDNRYILLSSILQFIDALANQDFESADSQIKKIMSYGQEGLFKEIGRLTRSLHDTMKGFSNSLEIRLKDAARLGMPEAADNLELVIGRTEDAVTRTLEILENQMALMSDFQENLEKFEGPQEAIQFMKKYKGRVEEDLMEILTIQSFQDITGQTLKKVIGLVRDVEKELAKLLNMYGYKVEEGKKSDKEMQKMSQT
ncbi:MAG: protein phosphatase CheZ, partial [Dissulfurispiraceae bacterium]